MCGSISGLYCPIDLHVYFIQHSQVTSTPRRHVLLSKNVFTTRGSLHFHVNFKIHFQFLPKNKRGNLIREKSHKNKRLRNLNLSQILTENDVEFLNKSGRFSVLEIPWPPTLSKRWFSASASPHPHCSVSWADVPAAHRG